MHTLDPPYAHNDLKPGNILLLNKKDEVPVAMIMDFGSAAPARRSVRSRADALAVQVSLLVMNTRVTDVSVVATYKHACNDYLNHTIVAYTCNN